MKAADATAAGAETKIQGGIAWERRLPAGFDFDIYGVS
jgi:hypothetical protein